MQSKVIYVARDNSLTKLYCSKYNRYVVEYIIEYTGARSVYDPMTGTNYITNIFTNAVGSDITKQYVLYRRNFFIADAKCRAVRAKSFDLVIFSPPYPAKRGVRSVSKYNPYWFTFIYEIVREMSKVARKYVAVYVRLTEKQLHRLIFLLQTIGQVEVIRFRVGKKEDQVILVRIKL